MPSAVTRVDLAWTNNVSFTISWSSTDADTGDDIDYSIATEIVVTIKDDYCIRLKALKSDGTVSVLNPQNPSVTFSAAQMQTLCEGQYKIGAAYKTDTGDGMAFVGTVTIIDGVARLP